MGQLFFTDENGRRWMCGWDNPAQGYYASRENNQPFPCLGCKKDICTPRCEHFMNDWQEFDVLIGFGNGVDIDTLALECGKYGLDLSFEGTNRALLIEDRIRQERPLTPLQKKIRAMFEGVLGENDTKATR